MTLLPLNQVFLLLGSNRGERVENLEKARQAIAAQAGKIIQTSSFYESEPWGFEDEILFINQVLEISTRLGAEELLKVLLEIEKSLGRTRPASDICDLPSAPVKSGSPPRSDIRPPGYSARTLDLDILFFGDQILFTENLMIPHPRLHERRFTLEPLHEIAPDLIHPILKKTVRELLACCMDRSKVRIL